MTFWKLLRTVQPGANTMRDVTQQGLALTSELDKKTNKQGKILVSATPMGLGGFQLQATTEGGPNVEKVYWLPWKDFAATCADRRWYEDDEDCSFFMTTALTGCRFTLTDTQVLHVANSAYEGPGTVRQGRTNVEEGFTGGITPLTRRLSISHSGGATEIQYNGHRTRVFGMRVGPGNWTYKIYNSHPAPGTWANM